MRPCARWRARAALALLAGVALSCEAALPSGTLTAPPAVVQSLQRYRAEYVLAPGDVVDVLVRDNTMVSRSCLIRPDGFLSLPLLDDVAAAGLTVRELDARVTELFGKRLREPEVTVIATTVRPAMVYVFGEVEQQKAVPLRDASTAAQAIAAAGGFKATADRLCVVVIRLMPDGHLAAQLVHAPISGQAAPYLVLQTMALQPDDLIFVPKSDIAQIDAWIDQFVNQPLSGLNSILIGYANIRFVDFLTVQ